MNSILKEDQMRSARLKGHSSSLNEDGSTSRAKSRRIRRLFSQLSKQSRNSRDSMDSETSNSSDSGRTSYRVMFMGGKGSGKTAIISQFLYDTFPVVYSETVEEMYRGDFDIGGLDLTLNIEDTGGSYCYEFPSMVAVSLFSADAVVLVFSLADQGSFEELVRLRELVRQTKGAETPIVVVGNKLDLERMLPKEEVEATVLLDWENGYVECSAKENKNVGGVFKELLAQTKTKVDINKPLIGNNKNGGAGPGHLTRRQSMPMVPAFHRVSRESAGSASPSPSARRRSIFQSAKSDNCRVS